MKNTFAAAACAAALAVLSTFTSAEERFPLNATFTTEVITPLAIEGLAADRAGNLYTTGRAASPTPCPVWRSIGSTLTVVARIPNPASCNPSGLAFDHNGDLYIADSSSGGRIWKVTPDAANATDPDKATVTAPFATGVPGTNGVAFDRDGNLWTGDGTTGLGRVWRIGSTGTVTEAFRIPPMANPAGVGRSNATLQPAPVAPNPQPLVANGLAFTLQGDLYVADTARGAIWKVEFDRRGELKSATGCDSTFTSNTLCLDNVFVAHPYLEGTDGIALDRAGNIWNSANERNAIVVVTKGGDVIEVFRTAVNEATGLRNSAAALATDPANSRILEFPTSPVLVGRRFCTSQSDGDRRDNSPRAAGEIDAGGAIGRRGKISCMDQELEIPGLPLPLH